MPIIVKNFANYYNHLQAKSQLPKKLRSRVIEMPRVYRTSNNSQRALLSTKFHSNSPNHSNVTHLTINNAGYSPGSQNSSSASIHKTIVLNINKLNKIQLENT